MTLREWKIPTENFRVDPASVINPPYGSGATICKVTVLKGLWITKLVLNVPEHGEGYVCADLDGAAPKDANDPRQQGGQIDDDYWGLTGPHAPTGFRTWTVPAARYPEIRRPTNGPYYVSGLWYASRWDGFSNFGGSIMYDYEKSSACARVALGDPRPGDRFKCMVASGVGKDVKHKPRI